MRKPPEGFTGFGEVRSDGAKAAAGRSTPASDFAPTEAEKGGKRSAQRFLTHVRSFGGSPEDQGNGGALGSRWRGGSGSAGRRSARSGCVDVSLGVELRWTVARRSCRGT